MISPIRIDLDPAAAEACAIPGAPGAYSDEELAAAIYRRTRTVAMVGASPNWNRPSYFVMKYLQRKGFRVIPVNPVAIGQTILGEPVVADLRDITEPVDVVDIFRKPEAVPGIVDAAIDIGAKVIWMQLGIHHEEAAATAEAAGLTVIQDRCMKIEYGRLSGELAWSGIYGDVISSRRQRRLGVSEPTSPDPAHTSRYGIETRSVHAGTPPEPVTGARNMPIFQTTAYVFEDADHAASLFDLQTFGYIYSRITNPTVAALEARVASLEGGRGAVAVASGHAAQLVAFYTLMEPGDHFVASRFLYGGSLTQFSHTFPRLGWHSSLVDPRDEAAVRAAITPRTKLIFTESLANPGGLVVDLEMLAAIAREHHIPLVVDNTLASPILCRPFEWGADIVVHSMTKFLGGHGTSMGGVVVESGRFEWSADDKFPGLSQPDPAYHGLTFHETFGDFGFTMKARAVALRDLGPALSPTNAFHILTGIETLPLRMERHVANALRVATYLESHPAVAWVSYAGLESSESYALARHYLPLGAGSVFTFGLKDGYQAGVRLVEGVNLWSHLANVGDTRSLIIHPASTTHRQLTDEQRTAAGAGNDVIRLSVGIETVEDLIADLDQALVPA